jgi:hypothetical protein
MNLWDPIIALGLAHLILYAWAGICFVCFRFDQRETSVTQQHFLQAHYDFFAHRFFSEPVREVTQETIKGTESTAWSCTIIPIFSMSLDLTYSSVLFSSPMLLFGGFFLARSWYGQRCMKMLGLEVYSKQAA